MNSNLFEIKNDKYFIIDMMYASLKNNMVGVAVYEEIGLGNRAFVHRDLWEKLKQAIPYLQSHNLKMKICDAYRPPIAHTRLKEVIPQAGFFASCAEASLHCHGTAIDICLCDAHDIELVYPTKVDAYDEVYAQQVQSGNLESFFAYLKQARHDFVSDLSPEALKNRAELLSLMQNIGLKAITNEWWHYELPEGKSDNYPLIDY